MLNRIKLTKPRFFIFLLFLILLGLYCASLTNNFVWDDHYLVVHNDHVKSFSNIPKIFSTDLFSYCADKFSIRHSDFYRPIQSLTYLIDFQIWKLNSFGYHLTNLILHFLSAVLLLLLLRILGVGLGLAFLISLIFSVHPIQTESVSYISGRAEILAAIFILLMVIAHIKYRLTKTNKFVLVSAFAFIAALLSKEMALVALLLIFLYDINFQKEKIVKDNVTLFKPYIYYLAIFFSYVFLRLVVFNFKTADDIFRIKATILERILSVPYVFIQYLKVFFFPVGLHMQRAFVRVSSVFDANFYVPMIFIALLMILVMRITRKDKLGRFFILWFLLTLLPQLNIFPINASMAEHWLYIPSMGLISFIVLWASRLMITDRRNSKGIFLGVATFVVLGLCFLTFSRNSDWKNDESIYRSTLKYVKDDPRTYFNLATVLGAKHDFEGAIYNYKKAIELKPEFSNALMNLGAIYLKTKDFDRAIDLLKDSIKYNPKDAFAYNALGLAYQEKGDIKEAEDCYKRSLEIKSGFLEAENNLANLYFKSDRLDEAIKRFRSIAESTNNSNAFYNLGYVYETSKDITKARESFKRAIEIDPANNLAKEALEKLKDK